MSNPAEQERESEQTDKTKYEELEEEESAERRRLAEKIQERLPGREDDDD
jgi:hypothetical protein